MVSLFDILGPIMVGPSSSHTAGACRLGRMARAILGTMPDHTTIQLHGSFAATGTGHGTQHAIVGGLLGMAPDDLRLRESFVHGRAAGLVWEFENIELDDNTHPNTAVFVLKHGDTALRVQGASVGGGRIEITGIDGFTVSLGGDYHTVVILAQDIPGTIATVAGMLAAEGVNLATMRVDRTGRRKHALMTIEADEPIPDQGLTGIRSQDWVIWARAVEKIS
jgi:L-serine dehydratase